RHRDGFFGRHPCRRGVTQPELRASQVCQQLRFPRKAGAALPGDRQRLAECIERLAPLLVEHVREAESAEREHADRLVPGLLRHPTSVPSSSRAIPSSSSGAASRGAPEKNLYLPAAWTTKASVWTSPLASARSLASPSSVVTSSANRPVR